MKVIAIANQKGGCAKTTTVVNLAAALGEQGQRVLVVDLDPQANASAWLGSDSAVNGSFRLMTSKDEIGQLIEKTETAGVRLISASRELAGLEKALAGEIAVETKLKRRLSALDPKAWDFVLLDTPPTLGLMTLNALAAAGKLLIPVTTHVLTLSGVAQLMATISEVRELLNPDLEILGLVPSRFDSRTRHAQEILSSLEEKFGDRVLKSHIHESIRLAEAPSFTQSILAYQSRSTAAKDYRALASEVLYLTNKP